MSRRKNGGCGYRPVCEEIWQEFPAYTQYEVRSALAKCGLTTKHIESKVRVLSGGEQAKVRLCKLINRESNILVLDEPTNHLDVDAKDELKRALKEYKGSILMVCHEPEFYEGLASGGLGLYEVDDKTCINEINKKGKSKWKKKRMLCGYWNRKKLPISRTAM